VITLLNSLSFSINSFILVLPKNVFPPSPIISNFSKDFPTPTFDIELPFISQLSQSDIQYFCGVGKISHFSNFKSLYSQTSCQYILCGLYNFIEIMFDDCCKYVFDRGGT